jgi:PAS domain S-box-containing protein
MSGAAFPDNIDHAEIRFLVEKNADGIIVMDEAGMVLFANPACEDIFGRAAESLIGSPVGIPLVTGETTEITIHKPDGAQVDAEIRVVRMNWGQQPARLASIRDVSARKASEEQLRHASKMEAIGRLTAGIAHDFNNLLTVVLGNLELAQRQNEQEPLARILDNATRGARRAAVLTERLLAFSRRKPLEPKLLNANALVDGMTDLLRRTLGETITVRTRTADDLWLIEADPTELETAILNLAVNARDAMPKGGDVIVETANVELDEAFAPLDVEVKPGPYVLISVTDTGTGMPSEILRQVFEPFFTTKPDGHGTGLGLSQVYGFVKQSGGHVKLYSEPNRGTTVKIYLPKSDAQTGEYRTADPDQRSGQVPVALPDEAVLVVEDDDDVRAYTVTSLRNLGYAVFEASDAGSAVQILKREPSIRLLLTDLGLPGGMDGKALALRARSIRRDLQVLITTAYAGNVLVHEGRLDRGIDLLSKPFTLSGLANRVRQMLDRYQPPNRAPRHVLVVDDELLLRMMLVDALSDDGYQLEEASNCAQALEKLNSVAGRLSAAVIDLGLPDRPGDHLVSAIRAVKPDIPIILTTGHADSDLGKRFSADSRIRVLTKPFDPYLLVDALRRLEG